MILVAEQRKNKGTFCLVSLFGAWELSLWARSWCHKEVWDKVHQVKGGLVSGKAMASDGSTITLCQDCLGKVNGV
jgi:hypothetical protein